MLRFRVMFRLSPEGSKAQTADTNRDSENKSQMRIQLPPRAPIQCRTRTRMNSGNTNGYEQPESDVNGSGSTAPVPTAVAGTTYRLTTATLRKKLATGFGPGQWHVGKLSWRNALCVVKRTTSSATRSRWSGTERCPATERDADVKSAWRLVESGKKPVTGERFMREWTNGRSVRLGLVTVSLGSVKAQSCVV